MATRCHRADGRITTITPIGNSDGPPLLTLGRLVAHSVSGYSCTGAEFSLQPIRACIINRVEHGSAAEVDRRPDPEAQAGRALRRLRVARNWTQEEVAVRMTAYGYDFHQTAIAKIEAAQRPLRVRELADFAALYGVEVQDLVYPPTRFLPEIDQEIAEVAARLDQARAAEAAASHQLESARKATRDAEAAYQMSVAEIAVLEGRLTSLSADRARATSWESDLDSSLPEGTDGIEQNTLAPTAASITSISGGPTVLRIVLGAHLRRLREANGMTREEVGRTIRASQSKVARLEMGRVGFRDRDVADLLTLYGVTDGKEREELRKLAQQANTPGWWHDYSDILPSWFETYIGLEMAAAEMWLYEVQSVPELLQTEDYSRAATPPGYGEAPTTEIERRVRLRMARQEYIFDRPNPPILRVVLDEAVLRRHVGGRAVMRDQIKHLAQIAEQPNMTVQVLPLQADSDSAEGSFRILQFPEPDLPSVVYLEHLTSALYLDKPEDVGAYQRAIERLSSQALTSRQTKQFFRELLG